MVKTLELAISKAVALPEAAQEQLGREMIKRIATLAELRAAIEIGVRELDAGKGEPLEIEDVIGLARNGACRRLLSRWAPAARKIWSDRCWINDITRVASTGCRFRRCSEMEVFPVAAAGRGGTALGWAPTGRTAARIAIGTCAPLMQSFTASAMTMQSRACSTSGGIFSAALSKDQK